MADETFASFARLSAFVTRSDLPRNEKLVLQAVLASVHWDSWSDKVPVATIIARSTLKCDAYQHARGSLVAKGFISVAKVMGDFPIWRVHPEAILRQPVLPMTGAADDRPNTGSIPDETLDRSRMKPVIRCRTEPVASSVPLDPVPPKIRTTEDPYHHEEPPTPLQGDSAVDGMDVPSAEMSTDEMNARATAQHLARYRREHSETPPVTPSPAPPPSRSAPASGATTKPKTPRARATIKPETAAPLASIPSELEGRADAATWAALLPSIPLKERHALSDVVALWDLFKGVFPRVKTFALEDVRQMFRIRLEGTYSDEELEDGIRGIELMGRAERGQWVFQSGSYMPRSLFSVKGKLEQAREVWARRNDQQRSGGGRVVDSKRDKFGGIQDTVGSEWLKEQGLA